ncbi:Golgi resident protein GCP60-like [Centruroides vittatus]|uniref:Golgi resident protein GCP60-like n=1 Tax=Centruroides vittatus TaxID=120091 RepID=UPI00350F1AA0
MATSINGPATGIDDCHQLTEKNEEMDEFSDSWGFCLSDLYKMATTFYKEKEGKAIHLSYKDKLSLVAYMQQVNHGQFRPENFPPVGYLDVIGRDRRQAWASLGDMVKETAMSEFIKLLDSTCSLFRPYVLAHKCDLEEKERIRKEAEEQKRREEEEKERLRLEEETRLQELQELQHQAQQKRLIQEALNRQTYHQFKAYAEQQYPGNPEQQGVLIRQLQEQHYQQYMQQVLQQQLLQNQKITQNENNTVNDSNKENSDQQQLHENDVPESSEDDSELPAMPAASMWTRKDVWEFKETIRKEGGDGIIKVGHGETVTVRVPTHDDGTCLFWEFATDNYDIGFGVYFEWTKNPGTQVSVHISESEDDDDEEEEENEQGNHKEIEGNLESGLSLTNRSLTSVIIPVYRRDCHEEVYAGSHVYPGQGIYLLKFDNSYSLWRSKTLYYRVYYTR